MVWGDSTYVSWDYLARKIKNWYEGSKEKRRRVNQWLVEWARFGGWKDS